jgi:hypothetical protein
MNGTRVRSDGKAKSRKQKAESRKQKAESRKQKAESRKQKAESRSLALLGMTNFTRVAMWLTRAM